MYVAIDRKPENGCEIQSAACGRSGIMIRLKLVKTADEEDRQQTEDAAAADDEGLLHGASVMKELVLPWLHTDRIVCGDSYFASVPAAFMDVELKWVAIYWSREDGNTTPSHGISISGGAPRPWRQERTGDKGE